MPIDPQIVALFANAPEWPPTRSQPIPQLREAVRASSTAFPKLEVPLASIVDRRIPGPAGEIPVRVYTPTGAGPFPLVSYFHGGGTVSPHAASRTPGATGASTFNANRSFDKSPPPAVRPLQPSSPVGRAARSGALRNI